MCFLKKGEVCSAVDRSERAEPRIAWGFDRETEIARSLDQARGSLRYLLWRAHLATREIAAWVMHQLIWMKEGPHVSLLTACESSRQTVAMVLMVDDLAKPMRTG